MAYVITAAAQAQRNNPVFGSALLMLSWVGQPNPVLLSTLTYASTVGCAQASAW